MIFYNIVKTSIFSMDHDLAEELSTSLIIIVMSIVIYSSIISNANQPASSKAVTIFGDRKQNNNSDVVAISGSSEDNNNEDKFDTADKSTSLSRSPPPLPITPATLN
jgi:hypothetical protein